MPRRGRPACRPVNENHGYPVAADRCVPLDENRGRLVGADLCVGPRDENHEYPVGPGLCVGLGLRPGLDCVNPCNNKWPGAANNPCHRINSNIIAAQSGWPDTITAHLGRMPLRLSPSSGAAFMAKWRGATCG